jgi:hypothetical protein
LFIHFELGLGVLKPMKPGIDVPVISMHEPRSVFMGFELALWQTEWVGGGVSINDGV